MGRNARIEYAGARYHLMCRGNRRETIVEDEKDCARVYPGHTGSFIDVPSKTIKAGGHGVPGGENMIRYADRSVRYFTTYEAKLLQTFPEEYRILASWTESMRQVGNAVPVKLANIISSSLVSKIWNKKTA